MTLSRVTQAVEVTNVDAAIDAVRAQGFRASTSRRMVLEAMFAEGAPVSAERIASGLAGRLPPLDRGSVYRNLETLEHLGLVRHFHAGHGPGLYTLAGRDGREYLVCDECGRVRALGAHALDPLRA